MANEQSGVKFFVILTTIVMCLAVTTLTVVAADEGDEVKVPILEMAKTLLKESAKNSQNGGGVNILGSLMEGLMQGDGKLGDSANVLSGLASAWQVLQQNQGAGGGFDPSVLGTMMEMFSTLNSGSSHDSENNNLDENNNELEDRGSEGKKATKSTNGIDPDLLLGIAKNFMSSFAAGGQKSNTGGAESIFSLLSVLMSSMNQQHNAHASSGVPHHTHKPYLPSFLENLHEYWDFFISTEFGKMLWENSGLAELRKMFVDADGYLDPIQFLESLENHVTRRRWVKSISSFVAQWVSHITNPESLKRYMDTIQILSNGFLENQGYPKSARINFQNAGSSISAVINAVVKRNLGTTISSQNYVKPAVEFIQNTLHVNQNPNLSSKSEIELRLRGTLDDELIGPMLRVYRAFKFALRNKKCVTYVLCVINKHPPKAQNSLKPAVTKMASMLAAWNLSDSSNLDFWDLYTSATETENCDKFNRKCTAFHDEDERAATEYYHTEL